MASHGIHNDNGGVAGVPPAAPSCAPVAYRAPQHKVGQPILPEFDEYREVALAETLEPDDAKAFARLSASEKRQALYYLALLGDERATVRGNAVTRLEQLMGRELRRYIGGMTDAFRPPTEVCPGLVAYVPDNRQGLATRARQSMPFEFTDTTGD